MPKFRRRPPKGTKAFRESSSKSQVHIGGKTFPEHVLRITSQIAQRMGTGFILCNNCTRTQDLTPELAEKYLAEGWPVCCEGTLHGGTMSYHRAEEKKVRA
jgi:hypothetical protein